MNLDSEKTKGELLDELKQLRAKVEEVDELRAQLAQTKSDYVVLKSCVEKHSKEFDGECKAREKIENELYMSQLIVARSPLILFRRTIDDPPKLEYISDNIRQFGYAPEEFLTGKITFRDIIHPDDLPRLKTEIQSHYDTDAEEYGQRYRCVTKSGEVRWVADETTVVRNERGKKTHTQGIIIDITKRKLVEDELRKSEEKFRRIVETAAQGFILMDSELVIIDVNNAYCRMMGYSREELIGKKPLDLATDQFREFMIAHQDSFLAKEYREAEGTTVTKDGRHVPILIHGNILRDDQSQIIGNMAFITDMTEHKKSLALAGEVQKSLLPQEKPDIQGLDIAGRNVSCEEIGGDYYDFIWRRDAKGEPLSVVVGDISGHGVDSALLMTTARAFLRMRASQPGRLDEVITAMNHHLANDILDTGRFMTLFYLTIDPVRKCLEWVRAGHDPALLYDPEEDLFEELMGKGIALGVIDEVNYCVNERSGLTNGQIIAIGTDGIWEASNLKGEMFGKERLRQVIRTRAGDSATTILDAVYEELNVFTVGQKNEDDITLVIIKVDGLA